MTLVKIGYTKAEETNEPVRVYTIKKLTHGTLKR